MKCPKCGKEGARYIEPRKREGIAPDRHSIPRTNFEAKHSCGFRGEIR